MQAENSFKTFYIMRTLKDIQAIYNKSGVKSLRDAELLQMIGIKTEQCDFTSILHANKEQLINNGIKPTTASKLEILGEIATSALQMMGFSNRHYLRKRALSPGAFFLSL